MKLLVLSYALAAMSAQGAAAAEGAAAPLQLQPKAALVTPAPHRDAPFVVPAQGPALDLGAPRLSARSSSGSSCQSDHDLCYDANSGHIVYKPARQLMPDIPGLRAENISVKRDRLVFRYSF